MAHQVLARKYRPQRFGDVAGQHHVTVTLMNALVQGRIAHGYIFSGHRGIGKTTIARILAMALNCRNVIGSAERPSAEPCERCESCTEIRAGNAVDVIEIDAATNRGIDEIRELRDAARYRPARDRYKIYILDEAHQITDAAFNALLKTLEEPPEHIVFMMATTQPEDIPQTIRSRCQHFSFHAVKMADILNELKGIARNEGVAADDAALNLLAEAGDGSMRDALSIMDQAIASAPIEGGSPRLDAAQIRELMGSVSNAIFERMLEAVDASRSAEVITIANELLDAGNSPPQLARQFVRYLRNCLMAKISGLVPEGVDSEGSSNQLLQTSADEQRRAARTAAKFSEEELTRFLQMMLRTFDELGYRQEQRLHFELGLLKLVHLRRLLPMEQVLSSLPASATKAATGGTRATNDSARARTVAQNSTSSASIGETSAVVSHAVKAVFSAPKEESARWVPARSSSPEQDRDATLNKVIPRPSLAQEPPSQTSAPTEPPEVHAVFEQVSEESSILSAVGQAGDRRGDGLVERLRGVAGEALSGARSQGSAADAIDEAEWTIEDGSLRIQTALSPTMLPMVVNPEADRIFRAALREAGAGGLRIELLPGKPTAAGDAKRPRGRAGSAQAKAEQHPIVQQAQKLFHAEIRKVIDLADGK